MQEKCLMGQDRGCSQFEENIRIKRCPAREGNSSQPAAPLHCFGSDVQIVLTPMQERCLMGQDSGCRAGDSISPIPSDECVLLCILLCGVLHYRPRTNSSKLIAILAVL
ncbi:hypothetical protein AVEN_226443-1 [Araneus ventricosus]|uniref:Uncharacterized protein n=1 Tax=Araneus ventricosus TaxID=182803 RepID=A0A4Y2PXD6_ARAVE|nr:hypothetical protein AVEN_226443-1 [Araneus ventricosus]